MFGRYRHHRFSGMTAMTQAFGQRRGGHRLVIDKHLAMTIDGDDQGRVRQILRG